MSDEPQLRMLLFRKRGKITAYACHKTLPPCKVHAKIRAKAGPCEFCSKCEDGETLEQVYRRITKGDA